MAATIVQKKKETWNKHCTLRQKMLYSELRSLHLKLDLSYTLSKIIKVVMYSRGSISALIISKLSTHMNCHAP